MVCGESRSARCAKVGVKKVGVICTFRHRQSNSEPVADTSGPQSRAGPTKGITSQDIILKDECKSAARNILVAGVEIKREVEIGVKVDGAHAERGPRG